MDGGSGRDVAIYFASDAGVTVNLETGRGSGGHAESDILLNIDDLKGSLHTDILTGDGSNNRIWGEGGRDRLYGGHGNDILNGGSGHDLLDGGPGWDTADYSDSYAAVTVNLETGEARGGFAQGDRLFSIEVLRGSDHDDVLTGDGSDNRFNGRRGDDEIHGGGGSDFLIGGAGADTLDGGTGIDTASYVGSAKAVRVTLDNNPFMNLGEPPDNNHTAMNQQTTPSALAPSNGEGVITFPENSGGDAEGDVLRNIENLEGSDHDDHLTGDAGANALDGGKGADTLTGGAGADTFVFRSFEGDRITDFENGEDRIGVVGGAFEELSFADAADGSGVTATWDGGSLTISGVQSTELTADDFIFIM